MSIIIIQLPAFSKDFWLQMSFSSNMNILKLYEISRKFMTILDVVWE